MKHHPLYKHIAQPDKGPSLGLTAIIGGSVAGLSLALSIPTLFSNMPPLYLVGGLLAFVLPEIAIILPLVFAPITARMIHFYRQTDAFKLVRLTDITPIDMRSAVIRGSIYRQRVLLACGAGFATLEIVTMLIRFGLVAGPPTTLPNPAVILLLTALRAIAVAGSRVGMMIVGIMLGVWFGLRAPHNEGAIAGAFVTTLISGLVVLFGGRLAVLLFYILFGSQFPNVISPAIVLQISLPDILIVVVPFILIGILWRMTLSAVERLTS